MGHLPRPSSDLTSVFTSVFTIDVTGHAAGEHRTSPSESIPGTGRRAAAGSEQRGPLDSRRTTPSTPYRNPNESSRPLDARDPHARALFGPEAKQGY